jgi:hypothetical protein
MSKVRMAAARHHLERTIEHACQAFEEVTGAEVDVISVRRTFNRSKPLYVVKAHHKSSHRHLQLVHKEPSAA